MQTAETDGFSMERLPKTGRIGRFIKMLEMNVDADAIALILRNADQYNSFSAQEKTAWWKGAIETLEKQSGRQNAITVMRKCGAKCCGKGQRNTAARLYQETETMEAFLAKISKHDVKQGDLIYTLEDTHTIIAVHNRCFCHQVAAFREPFDGLTYCHCSLEFNKQFFTSALGKAVHVELLQSIISGAETCKFKITF